MFCPKCGNQVKDGASFCNACGAQMAQKSASAPSANMAKPRANVASAALGAVASGAGAVGRNLPGAMKQVKRGAAVVGAKANVINRAWCRRLLQLSVIMLVIALFIPWMSFEYYDLYLQPLFDIDNRIDMEGMWIGNARYYNLFQMLGFWIAGISSAFDEVGLMSFVQGAAPIEVTVCCLAGIAGVILAVVGSVSALSRKDRGLMLLVVGLLLVFFASDVLTTSSIATYVWPEGVDGVEDRGSALAIMSPSNGCAVARVFSVVAIIAIVVDRLGFIGSLRSAVDMLTEEAQAKVGFLNQDGVGPSPAVDDTSSHAQPAPGTST